MIKDRHITYPAVDSIFAWQPESNILSSFVVAGLTTILTYQVTSVFFDVVIGWKRRCQVRVTDLTTLLLSEESSLLSAFANLFGSVTLARWRFHGFFSECPEQVPEKKAVKFLVLAKLFILLIAAPFINLGAVLLGLETDAVITFGDAKFGGIAMGINEDLSSVHSSRSIGICARHDTRYRRLETPIAEFFTCFHSLSGFQVVKTPNATAATVYLGLNVGEEGTPLQSIVAGFSHRSLVQTTYIHADIYTNGSQHRLRQTMTLEQGKRLFRLGFQSLLDRCSFATFGTMRAERLPTDSNLEGPKWNISQDIRCAEYPPSAVSTAIETMTKPITLVNSKSFELMQVQNTQSGRTVRLLSGNNMPLLLRRSSAVSFTVLGLSVIIVLCLKLVVRRVTNNDVHLAVEFIAKDKLGIQCCDSMLQSNTKVRYKGSLGADVDGKMAELVKAEVGDLIRQ